MTNALKPQGCSNLKLRQLTRMVTRHPKRAEGWRALHALLDACIECLDDHMGSGLPATTGEDDDIQSLARHPD